MPQSPTDSVRNPELDAIGDRISHACKKSRVSFLKVSDLEIIASLLGLIARTPADFAQSSHDEFGKWLDALLLVDPPAEPVQDQAPEPVQNLATELTPAPEPVQG